MHDIAPILDLINGYAAKGIMLPRTEFELSEAIRDFTVVTSRRTVARLRSAAFLQPTLGEIRSLAVHESCQDARGGPQTGRSIWSRKPQQYELDARLRLHLCCGFFQQSGISRSGARSSALEGMEGLPALSEIPGCDEIAVSRILKPRALGAMRIPHTWGHPEDLRPTT